jgi:hypothetical protein
MMKAATTAHLITATGVTLRVAARFQRAAFGAIGVAAIAMATDQHLDPAALAQEQPRRLSRNLVGTIAIRIGGHRLMLLPQSLPGVMMPLHLCSGTVWGTAPMQTATLGSVSCRPFNIGQGFTATAYRLSGVGVLKPAINR